MHPRKHKEKSWNISLFMKHNIVPSFSPVSTNLIKPHQARNRTKLISLSLRFKHLVVLIHQKYGNRKKKHEKQDELRKVVCRPVWNLRGCIFALSCGGNVCVQSSRLLDEPAPGELVFRKRILCIHACSTPAKPGPARQDVKLRHLNNFI